MLGLNTRLDVEVVEHVKAAGPEGRVVSVEVGVDIEGGGDEEEGEDAHDHTCGRQIGQLLAHPAARHCLGRHPPSRKGCFFIELRRADYRRPFGRATGWNGQCGQLSAED